jgi:hypothetical protein
MALVVRGCVDGERRQGQGVVLCLRALSLRMRGLCAYLPQMMTEVATVATSGFAVGIRT